MRGRAFSGASSEALLNRISPAVWRFFTNKRKRYTHVGSTNGNGCIYI
jgi:hypothetical protein